MSSGSTDRADGGQSGMELARLEGRLEASVQAAVNRLNYGSGGGNMEVESGRNTAVIRSISRSITARSGTLSKRGSLWTGHDYSYVPWVRNSLRSPWFYVPSSGAPSILRGSTF